MPEAFDYHKDSRAARNSPCCPVDLWTNSALMGLLGRSPLGLLAPRQVAPLTLPGVLERLNPMLCLPVTTHAPVPETWLVAEGANCSSLKTTEATPPGRKVRTAGSYSTRTAAA